MLKSIFPILIILGLATLAGAADKLTTKVYPVADLVVPIEGDQKITTETALIETITKAIEPKSWGDHGGSASIEYFPLGMALVVRQSTAAHEEINELLNSLRKLQDTEIVYELRLLSISEVLFEKLRADFALPPTQEANSKVVLLSEPKLLKLLDGSKAEWMSNVLQAPRITAYNGQSAIIKTGETFPVLTDPLPLPPDMKLAKTPIDPLPRPPEVKVIAKTEDVHIGCRFEVQGTASADGKKVMLRLKADVNHGGELIMLPQGPATTPEKTCFNKVDKFSVARFATIPNGSSMMVPVGSLMVQTASERRQPVVSHIPVFRRLVRSMVSDKEPQLMLLFVTPRIVEKCEECPQVAAAKGGFIGGITGALVGGLVGNDCDQPAKPKTACPECLPTKCQADVACAQNCERARVAEPQIMLKVAVAEVDPEALPLLGFKMNVTPRLPVLENARKCAATLTALKQLNHAKIVAEPSLVTLNGHKASFQSGGRVPVVDKPEDLSRVSFVPVGVQLDLTPTTLGGERIRLQLNGTATVRNPSMGAPVGEVPGVETLRMASTSELQHGQALIDIIRLGNGVDKRALVVMVTPELVQPAELAVPCKASATTPATCSSISVGLAEVIELSRAGINDEIILNQIRTTEASYTLTARDIILLKENKVSDRVVMAMQDTRRSTMGGPTGYTLPAPAYNIVPAPIPAPSILPAPAKATWVCPASFNCPVPVPPATLRAPDFLDWLFDTWSDWFSSNRSSDPNERMRQLLIQSEDLRKTRERPSTLSYERLSGAIGP